MEQYRFKSHTPKSELPTNLKVVKTREYLWRTFHFGTGAHLNWVTCWHVVDADTGLMVEGGYSSGNNTRSGQPQMERKRDAQAFIDGWMDELNGVERTPREYVQEKTGERFPLNWEDAQSYYEEARWKIQSLTKTGIFAPKE